MTVLKDGQILENIESKRVFNPVINVQKKGNLHGSKALNSGVLGSVLGSVQMC